MILAEKLNGEILSVDSMQVYRGMDIGTAKPGPDMLARIPHHLLDQVEVNEPFDVARYLELASQARQSIQNRGKTVICCGGTGLYFKALREGLMQTPKSDPELRLELERTPLEQLLAELQRRDPRMYEQVDRQNPRRVIRAVEVLRLTGQPCSVQRTHWDQPANGVSHEWDGLWLVMHREKEDLLDRINRRVEAMMTGGLVEETRRLLEKGLGANRTAMQAIGYREVVEYLQGHATLPQTTLAIKIHTRQYAKRQLTWFKHQTNAEWWMATGSSSSDLAERMIQRYRQWQEEIPERISESLKTHESIGN
jgi:tRNA dimethylallyltransferase